MIVRTKTGRRKIPQKGRLICNDCCQVAATFSSLANLQSFASGHDLDKKTTVEIVIVVVSLAVVKAAGAIVVASGCSGCSVSQGLREVANVVRIGMVKLG